MEDNGCLKVGTGVFLLKSKCEAHYHCTVLKLSNCPASFYNSDYNSNK